MQIKTTMRDHLTTLKWVCLWKIPKFNRSTNAGIRLTTILNGSYTKEKLDLEFHLSGFTHCCGNQGTEEGSPENEGLSCRRREIWGSEGKGIRSFPLEVIKHFNRSFEDGKMCILEIRQGN